MLWLEEVVPDGLSLQPFATEDQDSRIPSCNHSPHPEGCVESSGLGPLFSEGIMESIKIFSVEI